ncbi:MAG: hypothetical protein RIG61_13085 [Deltaproteobacteria bacterium]
MIKNLAIIVLAILLAVSSYLLYYNKNITIELGQSAYKKTGVRVETGEAEPADLFEAELEGTVREKELSVEGGGEQVEIVDSEFEPEIHLDPTLGMTISPEQQIVSSYKIIGPRKFALLTDNDVTMVEINLDTGDVKINPDYDLNEASTQFWKSIGKKYPEVCFTE